MMPRMGNTKSPKTPSKEAAVFAWANARGISLTEFNQIAAAVKDTYLSFRRGLYPTMGRAPRSEDEADPSDICDSWHKTAMLIVDVGTRVEPWITAQFAMSEDPYNLYANNLYDKDSRKRYDDFVQTERPRVQLSLECQADIFLRDLKRGHTPRKILTNPASQLSEIFIYCAAKAYKLDDLAAKTEYNAKRLLSTSPYREVYGERFKRYIDGTNTDSTP